MADVELRVKLEDSASDAVLGLKDKILELGAAWLSFEGAKKFVETLTEAETAANDLNRMFKEFGDTVGVTKEQMIQFADATSAMGTKSKASIIEAQATLLNFTHITGQSFKDATQLAVDLAARLGEDVPEAAMQLGRALEDPATGMRILRQLGLDLSISQRQLIQNMTETGRSAQAMDFILAEISARVKGADALAYDTLGGSLTNLKNEFVKLFEDTEAAPLVDAIHSLADQVKDPEFQQGIELIANAFVTAATYLAKAVALLPNFVSAVKDFGLNVLASGGSGYGLALLPKNTKSPQAQSTSIDIGVSGDWGGASDGDAKRKAAEEAFSKYKIELTAKELAAKIKAEEDYIATAADKEKKWLEDLSSLVAEGALSPGEATARRINHEWETQIKDIFSDASEGVTQGVKERSDAINSSLEQETYAIGKSMDLITDKDDEVARLGEHAAKQIQDSFASMFEHIGDGTKNILLQFLDVFKKIFAEAAALDLAKALGLKDIFSGPSNGQSAVGLLGSGIASIFGFAGGTSQISSPAIVGESGPELFIPAGLGSIVPNHALAGAGGTVNYSPTTVIQASEGTDMKRLQALITVNNDHQRAELMRMMVRNGYPRMR